MKENLKPMPVAVFTWLEENEVQDLVFAHGKRVAVRSPYRFGTSFVENISDLVAVETCSVTDAPKGVKLSVKAQGGTGVTFDYPTSTLWVPGTKVHIIAELPEGYQVDHWTDDSEQDLGHEESLDYVITEEWTNHVILFITAV